MIQPSSFHDPSTTILIDSNDIYISLVGQYGLKIILCRNKPVALAAVTKERANPGWPL